ncbi:RpiB/LacA/LacB family sugar-phosphate isomerase [Actinobaculum sp. 313]|uniref:RpiB/LacA/LacB family sugar-phosphate isomerase n=1 Tax=Actinobaculum sp. 313 TaxID=2495645 RepID=UPI000D5299A9|nr:RpiB/LacA/LacB family sugar-phosphate isomerase [Actinobaculum sp. 313]AWE41558.1 sugar phosphate isomerase [Actinobaculum sp. 313]
MRIGVIQAASQRSKNETLYRCTVNAIKRNNRNDAVINFGLHHEDAHPYSYIDAATAVSLLLSSRAVDFVVTGCSSGQGMMLACNSLPSVICGFVQTPQDAFLFGRINDGNAISLPLGLNFGWLGEINLQCTLDKLFDGDFGGGYPPTDAERKAADTRMCKRLNTITKRSMVETFTQYDAELMRRALSWPAVREDILANGRDDAVVELVREFEPV